MIWQTEKFDDQFVFAFFGNVVNGFTSQFTTRHSRFEIDDSHISAICSMNIFVLIEEEELSSSHSCKMKKFYL
jgi:hypothetical protein